MAIDFATFLTVAPHVLNSRLPGAGPWKAWCG